MNHNAILQELLLTNSPEERKSQLHCLGWREDDDLKRGANQNSHDPDGSCRCFKCFTRSVSITKVGGFFNKSAPTLPLCR